MTNNISNSSSKSKFTSVKKMIAIGDLVQHVRLSSYGIFAPSDFEASELTRLNLPNETIIATEELSVIANWEAVLIAKKQKLREIEVYIIEGLLDEHVMQAIVYKHLRKRLKKRGQVELILDLKEYMTGTIEGKAWAKTIPHSKTDDKMSELLGMSSGMIRGYLQIYRNNPQLIDNMDKEKKDIGFVEALRLSADKPKPTIVAPQQELKIVEADPTLSDMETEVLELEEDNTPVEPQVATFDPQEEAIQATELPKTDPPFVQKIAGSERHIQCPPIRSIRITCDDGREIELQNKDGKFTGTLDGIPVKKIINSSERTPFQAGESTEIHTISTNDSGSHIELIIRNLAGFVMPLHLEAMAIAA